MIYRRQRRQYVFLGCLAVIVVVNVLFFFILNRPARAEYGDLQEKIAQLDKQILSSRQYFKGLEKTSTQLDRFDQDKRALLMKHLVERNRGYSEIVTHLDELVKRTGVVKTRVNYNLSTAKQAGLDVVSVVLPVRGNYTNIVNFIRELETSETFFLITAISVEGTSANTPQTAPAAGAVELALNLETYFYE